MSEQSDAREQERISERVAQILVGQIRVALERRLASEEVSLVFQEVSDSLAKYPEQLGNAAPQNIQERIDALIIDMRLW